MPGATRTLPLRFLAHAEINQLAQAYKIRYLTVEAGAGNVLTHGDKCSYLLYQMFVFTIPKRMERVNIFDAKRCQRQRPVNVGFVRLKGSKRSTLVMMIDWG
jgi:hypothetical protein